MKYMSTALATIFVTAGLAAAADDVVIVYDASGSMWGQIDGVSKVEIAREVMGELVTGWDEDTNLGLVVYGHRRQGDCDDIETLVEPGKIDRDAFTKTVNSIRPLGKTPISASVQHAADLLSYRDSKATVVLISDGVETCNADPCALSEELAKQGINFTTHVVGFDLEDEAHASLACIAENTGGVFVPANNAAELHSALAEVQDVMKQASEAEAELEPELQAEAEPAAAAASEVALMAPERVEVGSDFRVSWSRNLGERDLITIVPAGADEGTIGSHIRVRTDADGGLTAPGDAGLYELRYVGNDGRKTLGSLPIEVVDAEVVLTGPEQVTTGSSFRFTWSNTLNPRDFITIVPAGSDEGRLESYARAGSNDSGELTAPGDAGLYELRYVLSEGLRTLASIPIEVVDAEMGIAAPEIIRAGNEIDISWSATINPRDFITIVPAGSDAGTIATYNRAGSGTSTRMKAPGETGLYEIRYVLQQGNRTLASTSLEVVDADAPLDAGAGMSVPESAAPGEVITITWTGGGGGDERITLARRSQPDFSWMAAVPAGEEKTIEITMPEEAGFYEIRFLDLSGPTVLGRSVVEVR